MTSLGANRLPDYHITETLYEGNRTLVYRATTLSDRRTVALKRLRSEYPSFDELLQFRNQYTIGHQLDHPGLVRMKSLVACGNGQAIVMENFSGLSLDKHLKQTLKAEQQLPLIEVLSIGVQLADILHYLGQQRIIHKDIKPANILIHPESKQIKLIDFGIASLLPRETQTLKNPNGLEGTLAYLAPEQTGRMNRGIDYRADFYALGITLFELLTGTLPFQAADPLEWVHCHMAKQPPLANDLVPMPVEVAAIVHKLMAKSAENRYQSALGLKHDLEKCLYQLKETGTVEPFDVGQRDVSDRFIIPDKLYGRETEIKALLAAFDRVAHGNSEVMLVAGFSGIGKTAVINEVHKPITRQRGYFIKGKYDQFNRSVPLSAFMQALKGLITQLLAESDAQLANWKAKILSAVGENGQVLINVIPELERIIGEQPAVSELSGTAAQNRFNTLLRKFIAIFTQAEHPLVLFLDDLQWADSASLELIKLLLEDKQHLFLLGAYRDNEVSPTHPFILTVDALKKAAVTVNTITLEPLSAVSMNRLVADTLSCEAELAQPLTELIVGKTQGNPFFSTQFLKALYEDGLITFNLEQRYWECNIAQIRTLALTDDVVTLMAQQIRKLPETTQAILKLAACIGAQFDLSTVAIVAEQSETATASDCWKALQEGLILPQSEMYKFYLGETEKAPNNGDSPDCQQVSYRFLHDRVQQAAYSLIPDDQKQATHLKIGQLLLANTSPDEREERLFDIVNHLNVGKSLITQAAQHHQLAELALAAGCKAKSSTAYRAAVDYFTISVEQLTDDAWESQYAFTLTLHEEMAEAIYLSGDFERLDAVVQLILRSAKTFLDKITTYEIQIQACTAQNLLTEAIEIALGVLKPLGVRLPTAPNMAQIMLGLAKTKLALVGKETQDLIDLPAMTDPDKLAAMRILSNALSAAFTGAPKLLPLLVFEQVSLSVKYGNMPLSAFAYSWYGAILCGVLTDIEGGYAFGQLAFEVMERFQANNLRCKILFMMNTLINPWKQHLALTLLEFQAAYQSGIETGDVEYAARSVLLQGIHSYWTGAELTDLEKTLHHYEIAISQAKQDTSLVHITPYRQAVLNLTGQSDNPSVLEGACYTESQTLVAQIAADDHASLFVSYVIQLQLRYLFGEITSAIEIVNSIEPYKEHGIGLFTNVLLHFYSSLTYLSAMDESNASERRQLLKKVAKNQKKLKKWAAFAPENVLHKWHLVEAERYRVIDQIDAATAAYTLAIAGAKEHSYCQDEGLANELTAKFYLSQRKIEAATDYMQQAYYGYAKWGAKAKTDQLERRYSDLLQPILQQESQSFTPLETFATIAPPSFLRPAQTSTYSSRTSTNTLLDFSTVLQAAQALSSTLELDELLRQVTQIILKNSGGDYCALILPNEEDKWCVEAIASLKTVSLCSEPIEQHREIPLKLIQYVKNTQKSVVLDDLATELPVIDEMLMQQQPKSLLCLPILNQSRLIGLLYLKNQATSGAFTEDRALVLNFLCSQAAISLENARLYQQAQTYSRQLEESQLQTVQNEKMATLGNLVAGVAHEVNNPIGFLNGSIANADGYLQDLLDHMTLYKKHYPDPAEEIQDSEEDIDLDFLSEDFPKLLSSMKGATDRIKGISVSLRTFSRTDTEHKVSANLNEGIDSTLLILKYRLKANENRPAIKVTQDYDQLPAIECFPGQLNQVFMNILANAIDALNDASRERSFTEIEDNPNRITVRTKTDRSYAIVEISDNGPGMPESVKQRIFDHSFTTKGVGKGTGLGLAISQKIIEENHGGTLKVISQLGQGTTFSIQVPIEGE